MVILELLLAHLLGDFVFQSNDLIHRKYQSWTGVVEHVCIITLFTIVFLFPYWNQAVMWETVGIIFALHFVQDLLKIKYDLTFNAKKKSTLPFFLDQVLHIALILLLAPRFTQSSTLCLPTWMDGSYLGLALYVIGLILVTFTYDITQYQFRRKKDKKNKPYKADYKGMSRRAILYTLLFAGLCLVGRRFM